MNLQLNRLDKRSDGIFGELVSSQGTVYAATLEHAYPDGDGWAPKIPSGTYRCMRSMHRLHGMTEDFETFMIMGVEGHSNLLFHWGNWNQDSDGCILLGAKRTGNMVIDSKVTFAKFMAIQKGLDEFDLTVD